MRNFFKNFFIRKREKIKKEGLQSHLDWGKKLIEILAKKRKIGIPNLRQLKYFPHLLTKKEKEIFIIFTSLLIISGVILLIRFYINLPVNPSEGGEYKEGIVGEINKINPIFSLPIDPDQDIIRLIFSGLTKWEDGKISPDLAENWEVKNEGKNYIFYLRKNIFWHDGKKIKADDIIFTIGAIKNKAVNSYLKRSLEGVKMKKIDDYTIEFSLEKPLASFPSFLTFGILPKHLWEKIPFEDFALSDLNLKPIGTGPFKFKSLLKDERGKIIKISLERNEKYYFGIPYIEKIHFKFFNSYKDAWEALLTKKIDGLNFITINKDLEPIHKIFNYYKIPLSYYTAIFFNQKSQIGSNKKIRRALAFSINKDKLIESFEGIKKIDSAIVNPDFKLEEIESYNYSIENANKNLKEEGFQKKGKWFVDRKGNPLTINFIVLEKSIDKEVGEIIKSFWEKLGIKTNLLVLNKKEFDKQVEEKKYDAVLYNIVEGYDPDPFPLWHSSQTKKEIEIINFKDIRVDALLEKGRMSLDKEERKKYYNDFQKIISKEVPAIFLYQKILGYFQNKEIKGFKMDYLPFPADRFAKIENWYIFLKKTK